MSLERKEVVEMSPEGEVKRRPHLSVLALSSFIVAFLVARTFTSLNPNTHLIASGFHIHHFWYGLALLVIGGWLGISYQDERIDRLAAIFFGVGGGLVGDEVGLLLTFENYWTGITYTFITVFLVLASILILFSLYSKVIRAEFSHVFSRHAHPYLGVFVASMTAAFILESDSMFVIIILSILTVAAIVFILAYFVRRRMSGSVRI